MSYKIEQMKENDKGCVVNHLKKLNEDDRYTRFNQTMTDFGIENYINGLDETKDKCFFIKKEDEVIAFSHLAYFQDNKKNTLNTDIGLSVLEDYRENGFGWKLIEHALEEAKNSMVNTFFVVTMKKNKSMHSLMKKMGDNVVVEDDEVVLELNLQNE